MSGSWYFDQVVILAADPRVLDVSIRIFAILPLRIQPNTTMLFELCRNPRNSVQVP